MLALLTLGTAPWLGLGRGLEEAACSRALGHSLDEGQRQGVGGWLDSKASGTRHKCRNLPGLQRPRQWPGWAQRRVGADGHLTP